MTGDEKPGLSREKILSIAADEFRRRGYEATSLERVAQRLGVTRPAIYYHFESKRQILDSIYERAVMELVRQSRDIARLGDSPVDALYRILCAYVSSMAANRDIVVVYFQTHHLAGAKGHGEAHSAEVAFTRLVAEVIESGQSQGTIRDGDARLMTNAFLGMMTWMHRWFRTDVHDVASVQESLWSFAKGGMVLDQG